MKSFKKWMLPFLVAISMFSSKVVFAQEQDKWDFSSTGFTRGSGFVIRPELYSGLFATTGYQINPFVQLSGGLGIGLDCYGGLATTLGVRTYTSDANWAALFDYHIGFVSVKGQYLTRHTLVGGASYKDFDFGAGLMYITDRNDGDIGLTITIGYNIRCYKHR